MTRQPQQSRSKATRKALLEATIAVMADEGWASTIVARVAERAGVSRGAAQHHFPTRDDLIIAALEYMMKGRTNELLAADRTGLREPERIDRIRRVVGAVVEHYTSALFKAALHMWTAAASDPELRALAVPMEAEMSRKVFAYMATEIGVDMGDEPSRRKLQTTMDLARGLGLADMLADDSQRRAKIVEAWVVDLANSLQFVPDANPAEVTGTSSGA